VRQDWFAFDTYSLELVPTEPATHRDTDSAHPDDTGRCPRGPGTPHRFAPKRRLHRVRALEGAGSPRAPPHPLPGSVVPTMGGGWWGPFDLCRRRAVQRVTPRILTRIPPSMRGDRPIPTVRDARRLAANRSFRHT